MKDLKEVYKALTEKLALAQLDKLKETWGNTVWIACGNPLIPSIQAIEIYFIIIIVSIVISMFSSYFIGITSNKIVKLSLGIIIFKSLSSLSSTSYTITP